MQTFVPHDTFAASAACLDYRRLGKQRVETLQLIRCNLDITLGWKNHPAAKMWADNINGLIAYGVAMCNEWLMRGYKDTCLNKILSYGEADCQDLPFWWGDERVHSSHRSNLLRKAIETKKPDEQIKMLNWYSQWGWDDDPLQPYVWPTEEVVLKP